MAPLIHLNIQQQYLNIVRAMVRKRRRMITADGVELSEGNVSDVQNSSKNSQVNGNYKEAAMKLATGRRAKEPAVWEE